MSGATQSPSTVPFPREQSWGPRAEGTVIPSYTLTLLTTLSAAARLPALRGANLPVPRGPACSCPLHPLPARPPARQAPWHLPYTLL